MAVDSAKLKAEIEAINDLPTLPAVAARISSQIANPATNAADIGRLIEQDQALTVRVLRLVNSAYYGFPKQIKSIQHAVVILGFNKVKTLIVTVSVFDVFKGNSAEGLNLKRFWQHSLGVALAAKISADMLGIPHSMEDAFIGGLLHDIGKVLLDQYQSAIYRPVLRRAIENRMLLRNAEEEALGVNHARIGRWLIEKWRLPPAIASMVGGHHAPSRGAENRELVAATHIGDILARAVGIGNGGDNLMPAIDPSVASTYAIDGKFFDTALTRLLIETAKAADFFSLIAEEARKQS